MQKYMLKAAEFYIGYVTRGPTSDAQIHGSTLFSKHIFSLHRQNTKMFLLTAFTNWCLCFIHGLFQALKMEAH